VGKGGQGFQPATAKGTSAAHYRLDAAGAVVSADPRFAELLGLDGVEPGGRPLERLERWVGEVSVVGSGGAARTLVRCESPTDDGGRSGLLFDATDLFAARDREALGRAIDVSGRALGAVGHELNNLLAIILNYSTMIAGELTPQHPLLEDVQEVQRSAQRAVALARKLLAVGRREPTKAAAIDVGEVTGDVAAGVSADDVTVETSIGAGAFAQVDPTQLEGILRALVENALDAMPDGGKLQLEVDAVSLAAHEIPGVEAGAWARIRVRDEGRGMDGETLGRAVEPFFTTKASVKGGVGIGLTTAFARTRQAGGHLLLASSPGEGTVVTLLLPQPRTTTVAGAVEIDVLGASATPVAGSEGPRRSRSRELRAAGGSSGLKRPRREVVLVVDDEDGVRALVTRLLARQGYTVLEARGPGEALLLAERHAGTIDLLLTDVVMPNMNGKELSERLVALRPGLKVLLMSGFAGDALVAQLSADTAFLQKPFTEEALSTAVRATLEDAKTPSGAS
jgi:signal transduction histidine kinase/CheY-like chemotaxis protein